MSQSTLHFAFGLFIGTLFALPPLLREWKKGRPVARAVARWCLLAGALGVYAVIPAIVRRVTGNPETGGGAWWNLFLFYPLFRCLPLPSILLGEMAAAAIFTAQYAVILLAIRRARRMRASGASLNFARSPRPCAGGEES